MKKICTFILVTILSISSVSVSALAATETDYMMDTIQQLSSNPRGWKDSTISNARKFIEDSFKECGLNVSTQEFTTNLTDSDGKKFTGVNIIGTYKPNTDTKTNDIVIIGAHYDGANGFPAANDNASGTAVMIEMARTLTEIPTDTEIRFVAFDAEEAGLLGSDYYANSITSEADNIVGMLNFDMLGAKKEGKVNIYSDSKEDNYLFDILKDNQYYSNIEIDRSQLTDDKTVAVATDNYSFKSKLIPTLSFSNRMVESEMHNEKDTIENIDPSMLEYAATAGKIIIKHIMDEQTPSYHEIAKPKESGTIYTILPNVRIPLNLNKSSFEEKLGIYFEPILSDTTIIKYRSKVKMFGMDKAVNLILEEEPIKAGFVDDAVANCTIDINNTDVSADELKSALTGIFGEPYYRKRDDLEVFIWNDINNGNQYSASIQKGEFYLNIHSYVAEQESYAVENEKLTRLESASPVDHLHIIKTNEDFVPTITSAKVSENLPVSETAEAVWEKIKTYLTEDELSHIRYFTISSDGINGDIPISMLESESKDKIIKEFVMKMQEDNVDELDTDMLMNGLYINIDFMDVLNKAGNSYTDSDLKKNIGIARAKCENSLNSPSEWAVNQIVNAINDGILSYDLQNNYKKSISRLDFCNIAYQIIKDNIHTNNANIKFSDTNSKEVAALAEIEIINGKENDKFAPDDNITREEAATILSRMAGYLNILFSNDKIKQYNDDSSISDWASDSVYKMKNLNIMNGIDDNNFAPKDTYTKEQAVVTVMRLYDIMQNI